MTELMKQVREAAKVAEETCMTGDFNAMSWLDLVLEENPDSFDCFFDTNWSELSDIEQQDRMITIRKVL